MNTTQFVVPTSTRRNYADMLIALWPHLSWRHSGFGALQAYIHEGEDHELRLHIWHPTLVKPGITESGLCHDHRFNMCSSVLVGSIIQTEFRLEADMNGGWETYTVLHAREAMNRGGSYHQDPVSTGERFHRYPQTVKLYAGMGYTFNKFHFHETHITDLTITLMEKLDQEEVNARIMIPYGKPIVHTFTETKTPDEFAYILAEGLLALTKIDSHV
jgi:hypothetical protein